MPEKNLEQDLSETQSGKSTSATEPTTNTIPKVCLIDIGTDAHTLLRQKLYDCTTASLGCNVYTPKNRAGMQSLFRPLVNLPPNLHEFHVIAIDLAESDPIEESEARADLKNTSGKTAYALVSSYPEQIFNLKGFGSWRLAPKINEILEKESIVIVFAAENKNIEYDITEIGIHGPNNAQKLRCDTLRVCSGIKHFNNKFGETIAPHNKENRLHPLLSRHLKGAKYEVTFTHPKVIENNEHVPDKNFIPLLVNATGEIVSYVNFIRKSAVFVFPQIAKKPEFLVDLFDNLAEIFPEVFPYNGMFNWLDDGSCPLPGEKEIRESRSEIENRYLSEVAKNELALTKLKHEYNFLRIMLSGTGEELVSAVKDYLTWLEFPSVKAMDEHSEEILEEDIQAQLDPGLLVIEVKGVGGTSKDKECAQIAKIKNRRQEERRAWDVSALYIVNHQRYVSPNLRKNPPFTQNQIKDAQLDKRGLITTYQLYNAYFDILRGLISKEDARKQLLGFGHIKLTPPQLNAIGTAKEIFQQGRVVILNLENTSISVGSEIYVFKSDIYEIRKITGLQLDGIDIDTCTNGEVGIKLDNPIKKGSQIFLSASAS